MGDRILRFALGWGLLGLSLIAFGFATAVYFALTSLVLGSIWRHLLREGAERDLRAAGLEGEALDRRMLPRDRAAALLRAVLALAVALAFYRLA